MSSNKYESEDEILLDALRVFRELKAREKQQLADVAIGIDQADRGLARSLDVNALIDRCTRKLNEDGIFD